MAPMEIGVCEHRLANVIGDPLESCRSLINEPVLEIGQNGHVEFIGFQMFSVREHREAEAESCIYCYVSKNILFLKISYFTSQRDVI